MPYTCCVPGCRGNYKTGPTVRVFSFPDKEKNSELHRKWLRAIKRDDFIPNKKSKVCERHFSPNDIRMHSEAFDEKTGRILKVTLQVPRLLPEAIPTVFPDLPSYLSSTPSTHRECPETKRMRRECAAVDQAIAACLKEQEEYEHSRRFSSFTELKSKLYFFKNSEWKILEESETITFYKVVLSPCPRISKSVTINLNLQVEVCFQGVKIVKIADEDLPVTVNHVNSLDSILNKLDSCECGAPSNGDANNNLITVVIDILKAIDHDSIPFVIEQLTLLNTKVNARRYSAESMIFASLFFSLSPSAYRFVRQTGKLILPHEATIHALNLKCNLSPENEQCKENFLSYSKKRFDFLDNTDKIVNLLVDEIYMKKYWDYKGGSIVGASHNSTTSASSAHVFMISSVKSKFKDVVHILPVSTINAEVLYSYIRRIIIGLEDIGYKVISVISDNNKINSKAMSFFATPPQKQIVYPHPRDSGRPLFFVLDTVHLLKCIRNCWLRQKNEGQSMIFPKFTGIENSVESSVQTASLCTLKKLHSVEVNSLAKFGYSLSFKALAPSNLERQNVKLTLQIFNQQIIEGLMEMGAKLNLHHYEETANYIKTICTWWEIVNVRSPFTGTRLRNNYQTPLTNNPEDVKFVYLHKFMDWLDAWEKMQSSSGKLTRETHAALKHSTYALIEIAEYCIKELNFQYILPGKFQTDDLESRFGLYRSLAGSQYYISLRQLYECETKLRLQSHLRMNLSSKKYGDIPLDVVPSSLAENDTDEHDLAVEVSSMDFEDAEEYLPVLVYIAGYCAFSVVKRLKCDHCQDTLLLKKELPINETYSLIGRMDRGALSYPNESVVTVVTTNYLVVKKLCFEMETEFLKLKNQRAVAAALTMSNLQFEEDDKCLNGHQTEKVIKMIVWSSTNCFLNNYCKKQNDIQREKGAIVRKLQTLSQ